MNSSPHNSLINGIAADFLNINDRSIHYGDGLFETILCSDNKLYYWQRHFQRLQASAKQLKIKCPAEQVFLDDIAVLTANSSPGQSYVIKIILSRGISERGYRFTPDVSANRIVMLSELEAGHSSLLSSRLLGGELFICEQQVSINQNLAGLKHLNRLDSVMARNEWNDKTGGFIDGLMSNADQHVIEGSMSNLFAVKDNQLFTPNLARSGVNGIMRDLIIDLAAGLNIRTTVTELLMDELLEMDELFITNSLIGMKQVTKLGVSDYKDHAVSHRLFKELLKTKEDYAQVV